MGPGLYPEPLLPFTHEAPTALAGHYPEPAQLSRLTATAIVANTTMTVSLPRAPDNLSAQPRRTLLV